MGKVAGGSDVLIVRAMIPAERLSGRTPTGADIDAIARRTLALLPSPFRESLGEIVLAIEDVADARHGAPRRASQSDASQRPL